MVQNNNFLEVPSIPMKLLFYHSFEENLFTQLLEICSQETRNSTVSYGKNPPVLADWSAVTVDEVGKLIGSAPAKACQLDPVPTWLVKDFRGLLSPFVALLCNTSLVTGCFPSEFKPAVICPLLKKWVGHQ